MQDNVIQGNMETIKHIHRVRELIHFMEMELDKRARLHDLSKLESPEQEIFGEWTPELCKVEYGSPEYYSLLEKVKPAIEHHYANNRHHPEHHKRGIDDMNLIDLIEMLCDWKAAGERNKNGNIRKSMDVNAERYEMSEQLVNIFSNTIKEFF